MWNIYENEIVPVIVKLVPIVQFKQNTTVASQKPPPMIKNKINIRNCLLKHLKHTNDVNIKSRMKNLNLEIKNHFVQLKKEKK